MVEVNHVSWPFASPFIKNITFSVSPGEITGVIGKCGAGKTIFLQLLSGEHTPFTGELTIQHFSTKNIQRKELLKLVSLNTLMTPRNHDETLESFLHLSRMPYKKIFKPLSDLDLQIIEKYIEGFGLQDFRNFPLKNLSGGTRQFASLACQFSRETPLMLFDEPVHNLSPAQIKVLIRQMNRYVSDGRRNIFIASNNISFLAQVCDSMVILQDGQLIDIINTSRITAPLLSHYLGTEIFVSRNIYNGRPEIHIFPEN